MKFFLFNSRYATLFLSGIVVSLAVLCVTIALPLAAVARDTIRVVGSSTVYPFATAVAEEFGRSNDFKTPVIESTGTGGGFKLFCSGIGLQYPDIINASRRIKKSEFKKCKNNGIDVTEVLIGYDGIVLVNALRGPVFSFTKKDIFLALAAEIPDGSGGWMKNPYQRWSDIRPGLPNIDIAVFGPPPTSGTRDAFVELAMEGGAQQIPVLKELRANNKKLFKGRAHTIREDGAYREVGENDNLVVRKLTTDDTTLGIFGFSFLDQNNDKIKGASMDGIAPTFTNIAAGKYNIARPLYFYVKNAHLGVIPGMREYVELFTSDPAWGEEGFLPDRGLVPLPFKERRRISTSVRAFEKLTME